MAILQSNYALGVVTVPHAFTAGAVVAYQATFTIPTGEDVDTTDIIELAVLPADHKIVDALIIPSGDFDGATADIGIMDGAVGDPDSTRTSDDSIFDGVALTALARVTAGTGLLLDTDDEDRSIGVTFSKKITGAGQKLTIQILMTQ